MKRFNLLIVIGVLIFAVSCSKDSINILGGTQSPIGDVSNVFSFSPIPGASNVQATIVDLTDGVSTINYSADFTEQEYLDWAGMMMGVNINGSTVTGTRKYRFTSEGIQSVADDGSELMMVKYNGKVGDKYRGSGSMFGSITREVIRKSSDDDFLWNGFFIKTIDVETNEFNFPGVSYFEFFFNHRFGLVSVRAHFENGTTRSFDLYSSNTN